MGPREEPRGLLVVERTVLMLWPYAHENDSHQAPGSHCHQAYGTNTASSHVHNG